MKVQVVPRFPSQIVGINPISVTKTGGVVNIGLSGVSASILNFGVRGDGSDETAKIQAAIYTPGVKMLLWPAPPVAYGINSAGLFGVSNQVWQGDGAGVTSIRLLNNTTNEMVAFAGKSNFEIRDMTLDYDNRLSLAGNLSGINIGNSTDFALRRVRLIHGNILGFTFSGCSDGVVEDCRLQRDTLSATTNQAILFTGNVVSSGMRIQRNKFVNWGMNHGNLTDSWIVDNLVDGFLFGGGLSGGGSGLADTRNIIRNNIIRNGSDQLDSNALRPQAIEQYTKRSIIDGNICYANGGSAIRSSGDGSIVTNNICYNNGTRQLITAEKYAGIEIRYIAADVPASRVILHGNQVFTDNPLLQAYGLWIDGGAGAPNAPEYMTLGLNSLHAPVANVFGTNGRFKTFLGPALEGSAAWNPPNIANGAGATVSFTVAGAALGDKVVAGFSLDLQGLSLSAYVNAANNVIADLTNNTGGAIDLGAGTVRVIVLKHSDAADF